MASQVNIVAYDGAATPISHTFQPAGTFVDQIEGLIAEWREILASVPTYAQLKVRTTQKQLKSGMWRLGLTVFVPVMESVSGPNASGYTAAAKVAYINQVSMICYFHERATAAERRLARQLLVNVSNNIPTSVAAATTGVASDLIDSNISAS